LLSFSRAPELSIQETRKKRENNEMNIFVE